MKSPSSRVHGSNRKTGNGSDRLYLLFLIILGVAALLNVSTSWLSWSIVVVGTKDSDSSSQQHVSGHVHHPNVVMAPSHSKPNEATTTITTQQHQQQRNESYPSNRNASDHVVFSVCLLTKDDIPILPEWIAYHYHAVGLRHLVVAVDPNSKTDPQPILDRFQRHLPNLRIDRWNDADFMPNFFLQGNYSLVPNFMGVELHDKETFGQWYTRKNLGPVKRRDMTHVNNHRYRQTRFLASCSRHLVQQHPIPEKPFVATLDTDEYLVANPWKMTTDMASTPLGRLETNAVLQWALDSNSYRPRPKAQSHPCVPIPRLLFGSIETNHSEDTTWALLISNATVEKPAPVTVERIPRFLSPMETLRWKFHAAYNDTRNFQQKVLLDLHAFPPAQLMSPKNDTSVKQPDELWGDHVNSVHRPSRRYCPEETSTDMYFATSPVAIFHYIGSVERYFARPNDLRRNAKRYRERSNLTYARESGWIDQWLPRFVEAVGLETTATLLQEYCTKST